MPISLYQLVLRMSHFVGAGLPAISLAQLDIAVAKAIRIKLNTETKTRQPFP